MSEVKLNTIYNEDCLEKPGVKRGYKQSVEHVNRKAEALRRGSWFHCQTCQTKFWRKPSEIKKGSNKVCSRDCYTKYQKGKTKKFGYRPHVMGKNNPRWRGGITPENNKIRSSKEYKDWRKAIFRRDMYACVECGVSGAKKPLNADHIKGFADFPELRFDINNGRTLCIDCHKATPNYGWKYYNATA